MLSAESASREPLGIWETYRSLPPSGRKAQVSSRWPRCDGQVSYGEPVVLTDRRIAEFTDMGFGDVENFGNTQSEISPAVLSKPEIPSTYAFLHLSGCLSLTL